MSKRKNTHKEVNRASKKITRIAARKPLIFEIKGPLHWKFFEEHAGSKDYRRNHIINAISNSNVKYYTSPSIERKIAGFKKTVNRQYQKIDRNIDLIVREVNILLQDLESMEEDADNLMNQDLFPTPIEDENKARWVDMITKKRKTILEEKHEIQRELADIKGIIDAIDKAMVRFQETACSMLEANLACYWGGVLKKANQEDVLLPPTSGHPIDQVEYEQRLNDLRSMVEDGLNR